MTQIHIKYVFRNKCNILIWFSWFRIKFGHNAHTRTLGYADFNSPTLLIVSIVMVYTPILRGTGYVPKSVPKWHNIYGTLISLLELLIYEHNPISHWTPLRNVCSHSHTKNHLFTRSPLNQAACIPRLCIEFNFLLWAWIHSPPDICWYYTMRNSFYWQTSRPPLRETH